MVKNIKVYSVALFSCMLAYGWAYSQDIEAGGLLANEELEVDNAITGDLPPLEEIPLEEVALPDNGSNDEISSDSSSNSDMILPEGEVMDLSAEKPADILPLDDAQTTEGASVDTLVKEAVQEQPEAVDELTLPEEVPVDVAADVPVENITLPEALPEPTNDELTLPEAAPADVAADVPVEDITLPEAVEKGMPVPPPKDSVSEMVEVPKVAESNPVEDVDQIIDSAMNDAFKEGIPAAPDSMTEVDNASSQPIMSATGSVTVQNSSLNQEKASSSAPVVDKKVALSPALSEVVDREELKRMAEEDHAKATGLDADLAFKRRRYDESIRLYTEALNYIGNRSEVKDLRDRYKVNLAESFYRDALAKKSQRKFEDALKSANRASDLGHKDAGKLITLLNKWIEDGAPPPPPLPVVQRIAQKDYKDHETEVADYLRQGREYYVAGEYDLARLSYEGAIKRSPQNTEAIRMLGKIGQKRYDRSTLELEATRKDMMAQVRSTWNPRNYAIGETARSNKTPSDAQGGSGGANSPRLKILDKMNHIVLPEIDFREANIHDVIDILQSESVEFDPSTDPNEAKGVNIILNMGGGSSTPAAAAQAAAPVDPFAVAADVGAADNTGGGDLSNIPITFKARSISLLEALKIVTSVAGLKYRIQGNVVMVVPLNFPDGEIITRMYSVLPTVGDKIKETAAQVASTSANDQNGFTAMDDTGVGTVTGDFKSFFKEMGVDWPIGSSIKNVPGIGKIVVANTEDNLIKFEKILSALNVVPNQIEIEARFVDIRESDLNELGFDWLLTDDYEMARSKSSAGAPVASQPTIQMKANGAEGGFTMANRKASSVPGVLATPVADNVMTIASVLTNPEVTMILRAIKQKGNSDLLSAPKVTAQAGTEAVMKVVTEYIYPTSFTVTPITATAGGGAGSSQIIGGIVEPSGFETREVGVILSVVPNVSPEGQIINLDMKPEVVTDPIWRNYGTTFTDPAGKTQQLNMEQPFFKSRSVTTRIAIYNGATVVMGGMITENRIETDDRIPILGDIPIIGRLFRTKMESSEKHNLLIFVTARLVDPAGRPIQSGDSLLKGNL